MTWWVISISLDIMTNVSGLFAKMEISHKNLLYPTYFVLYNLKQMYNKYLLYVKKYTTCVCYVKDYFIPIF